MRVSGLRKIIQGSSRAGNLWGCVIGGLGLLFGVIELAHIRALTAPADILIEGVFPFLGVVGLIGAGYAIWRRRYTYDDADVPRVVGWTVIGMTGMAIVFLWHLRHQLLRTDMVHHSQFLLVNHLIAGSLLGFIIGTYDARSRTYRRSLTQEQLKHTFVTRELRHHVLNGMTVILGQLDHLEQQCDSPPTAASTIRHHGEEIAERVQRVRRITRTFTEQESVVLSRQNLSAVVSDVIANADARYEEAVISAEIPAGITVSADEFLDTVFENLLSNAIEHNDANPPRVHVSLTGDAETAIVRIADNGPGIPDAQKESLFEWDEPAGGKTETGVGLAIVMVLVDRYDGTVQFEDNDPTGTVAHVELNRLT